MEILVNIDVPSLQAGIAFYERATDLVFERLLFDGTVAELSLGTTRVLLIEKAAGGATLADPFGHGFCFIEWLGRGYDEVATPEQPT